MTPLRGAIKRLSSCQFYWSKSLRRSRSKLKSVIVASSLELSKSIILSHTNIGWIETYTVFTCFQLNWHSKHYSNWPTTETTPCSTLYIRCFQAISIKRTQIIAKQTNLSSNLFVHRGCTLNWVPRFQLSCCRFGPARERPHIADFRFRS